MLGAPLSSRRSARLRAELAAAALALVCSMPARAESPGCTQAQAIVDEVKRLWDQGKPDHKLALAKLATARDLCPALGEVWKYSYCSAKALHDETRARIYKERAIFNGVAQVECEGAAGPEPLPSYVREKFALLVGVSDFADPGIQDLQFAAKDAQDLQRALLDPRHGRFSPGNVYLLTDAAATREAILKDVNEIALRARPDDLVLFFFSSHGSPRKDGLGLQGVGYIILHDTKLDEVYVNSLEFEDLRKQIARIAARRKVLLLDTCYSGQADESTGKGMLLEGAGIDPGTAKLFLSGEGSYVITSSRENEKSWESESLQNGYFTHFLIDALEQGQQPPSIKQLFGRLSQGVRDAVAREKKAAQNPRLFPEDGQGDVRIGVACRPSPDSSEGGTR